MDKTCPYHSGIDAEIKALCTKIDLRFGEVNRRVDSVENLIARVGILEKGMGYREGSRHWSDYIVTGLIAAGIYFLAKLMHL